MQSLQAPFQIKIPAVDRNYWFKLKKEGQDEFDHIFVRANETFSGKIPLGTYTITFCTGRGWLGEKRFFGEDTRFFRLSGTFQFFQDGDRIAGGMISLLPQTKGNVTTEAIDASEF